MGMKQDTNDGKGVKTMNQQELIEGCNEAEKRINQLCDMVNSYAQKLGVGKKVNAEDWTDFMEIASKKVNLRKLEI